MITLWITPVDLLYLRGNKLFGEAGDDAQATMPPWPSLAAGAIRSRMLVDGKIDLAAFAKGEVSLPPNLHAALGTPDAPGSFRLSHFGLAIRDGETIQPLLPLPADLVVQGARGQERVLALTPKVVSGIIVADTLPMLPLLESDKQEKARSGYWLTTAGLHAYFAGRPITPDHICHADSLWKVDARLGIGIDAESHRAGDGRIYTSDAVALSREVGFVASVDGVEDKLLPQEGLLRLGGDGRAATVRPCQMGLPQPEWEQIARQRRFKLVLTSPGIFDHGWQLPGMADGRWHGAGGSARICAAAVGRAEVISGWDIARHAPKPAQRVAPIGSIYWLDDWQGDLSELQQLSATGLPCAAARQAEGFNHCMIATWV
ncbi:MAG: type III-B CRISPR module-associated Cmr3 family protein [Mariprofundales bacterium]|nr:type III-B CRISPR module-associated Cmr3 family protein [Mariprofundales bacterium]